MATSEATKLDRDDVRNRDHRDLSKRECLFEIGNFIGFHGHKRSQLSKYDLNSIHWYINGEHTHPRIDFGTERSPDHVKLRTAVAGACGFPYSDWGSWSGGEKSSRPFRRNELRAIVHALRNSSDNRQQTPGSTEA